MTLPLLIALLCAYVYGAFTDYRRREIEDKVPIIIMVASIIAIFLLPEDSVLYIPLVERIIMMVSLGIVAFIPNGIGGGDMKLLMATGFCFGFAGTLFIMVLTAIGSILLRLIKKMKKVPMATVMLLPTIMLLLVTIKIEIL